MKLKYLVFILLLTPSLVVQGQTGSIQIINNVDDILEADSVLFNINAASDSTINYEVIQYKGMSGKIYLALVIKQNGQKLLEWLEIKNDKLQDLGPIDLRRKMWIETCNQNNAGKLIDGFYAEDVLYYNHKPLVQGRDALKEDYRYMNNPNYKLKLIPLIVEPINSNVVYEIGQCEGSYNGKYILIWEKSSAGDWMIKFDSNI